MPEHNGEAVTLEATASASGDPDNVDDPGSRTADDTLNPAGDDEKPVYKTIDEDLFAVTSCDVKHTS